VVQEMFTALYGKGLLEETEQQLPWCDKDQRFLPDRYVEGTCPHCGFESARGDQCDNCGKILDAKELLKAHCQVCGNPNLQWKPTKHIMLKLPALEKEIAAWAHQHPHWRKNAINETEKYLAEGLRNRAITRDMSWGIPVPLPGYDEKRIYVWFEAVCGYLSASKEWAEKQGKPELFRAFWDPQGGATHYYVHGKDNIPFHTVIWPFILMGVGGLKLPDFIISSEFLNLEKSQFSKSRGWTVDVSKALAEFGATQLRYYLIMNGPEQSDANFGWDDFAAKVNGELLGKVGNFVNRSLSQIEKNFPEGVTLPASPDAEAQALLQACPKAFETAAKFIENGEFRNALWELVRLCEEANRYLDKAAPWKAIKTDRAAAATVLAIAARVSHCVARLSAPFMPEFSAGLSAQLGQTESAWEYPQEPTTYLAKGVKPLILRADEKLIAAAKASLNS
jgi:methionyl-tRNA synthetase